jgi:hypothetical protein
MYHVRKGAASICTTADFTRVFVRTWDTGERGAQDQGRVSAVA